MTSVTSQHIEILYRLHKNLSSPHITPISIDEIHSIIDFWLTQTCRHDTSTISKPNFMHIMGISLCAALQQRSLSEIDPDFSEETIFGEFKNLLILYDKPIADMTWQELQDTITAVQIEFRHIVYLPEKREDATGGICSHIDLYRILIMLLRRMGFWATHKLEIQGEQSEVFLSNFEQEKSGCLKLRQAVLHEALDAIHGILSMYIILINAKFISADEAADFYVQIKSFYSSSKIEEDSDEDAGITEAEDFDPALDTVEAKCLRKIPLYNHHREASLDGFYEVSMVSDLSPGAIIQYKNKFRYLFHSISQVIFYHHPSYARQIQQPLTNLTCYGANPVNLLPLLRQVEPSIPILYEHTGAGLTTATHKQKFSWLVTTGFVLLIDDASNVYCAHDLRCLLAFAISSKTSSGTFIPE